MTVYKDAQAGVARLRAWDIMHVGEDHPEGVVLYITGTYDAAGEAQILEFMLSLEDLEKLLRVEEVLVTPEPVRVLRLRGIRQP